MFSKAKIAGLTIAALIGSTGAFAQSDSPFSKLSGTWSGTGTVGMSDGHSERIRCRATYEVVPSGIIMHQNLRCASDSYKFEIKASVQADGTNLLGSWTEVSRQVSGQVSGSIHGDQFLTSVSATGFSAQLSVVTKGNAQTVTIKPEGTDVQLVQVDMKRG